MELNDINHNLWAIITQYQFFANNNSLKAFSRKTLIDPSSICSSYTFMVHLRHTFVTVDRIELMGLLIVQLKTTSSLKARQLILCTTTLLTQFTQFNLT